MLCVIVLHLVAWFCPLQRLPSNLSYFIPRVCPIKYLCFTLPRTDLHYCRSYLSCGSAMFRPSKPNDRVSCCVSLSGCKTVAFESTVQNGEDDKRSRLHMFTAHYYLLSVSGDKPIRLAAGGSFVDRYLSAKRNENLHCN